MAEVDWQSNLLRLTESRIQNQMSRETSPSFGDEEERVRYMTSPLYRNLPVAAIQASNPGTKQVNISAGETSRVTIGATIEGGEESHGKREWSEESGP